jgi:hypothetical protein
MTRKVDWDGIPDARDLLPAGDILFSIEDMVEGDSKNGKAMVIVNLRAKEPKRVAGLGYTVRFTIGNDKDPKSDDPDTIKACFGGILLKKMLKKAGVRLSPDMEKTAKAAEGSEFVGDIVVEPDKKNPERKNNDIKGFYSVGERQPKLRDEGITQRPTPAVSGVDDED